MNDGLRSRSECCRAPVEVEDLGAGEPRIVCGYCMLTCSARLFSKSEPCAGDIVLDNDGSGTWIVTDAKYSYGAVPLMEVLRVYNGNRSPKLTRFAERKVNAVTVVKPLDEGGFSLKNPMPDFPVYGNAWL